MSISETSKVEFKTSALKGSEIYMTKETGFHKNTSKLTKNFDNYNGYWLPLEYDNLGAIKEYSLSSNLNL